MLTMDVQKNTDKVNLLDTVPVPCSHVLTEWEGECAVLVLPRFKQKWMQRWLLPKSVSSYIRVELEEHGTAVWQLIDGKRTVGEIIVLLSPHFNGEENYSSRVTTYLMRMQRDGIIRLITPIKQLSLE